MRRIARSPSGSKSAQLRGDGIVDRRCGSRIGRERRPVFRQIRGVAGHALFRKHAGSNELKMSCRERGHASLRIDGLKSCEAG